MTVLAGVAAGVLVGCGPAPSPDFECVVGEEARPCNRREVARAEEDFAEVERRYRAADHDINQLMMHPGEKVETPNLDQYAADQFLAGGKAIGEGYVAAGERNSSPIPIERVQLKRYMESRMTIVVCADATDVEVLDDRTGETIRQGERVAVEVGAEGREKGWTLVSAKNVDTSQCEELL